LNLEENGVSESLGPTITLAHGNGGRFMRLLITQVFAPHLGNPTLDTQADAAPIVLPAGENLVSTSSSTEHTEEGVEVATLERIVRSLGRAAREAGVSVVAGDTKVLPRGHGGGVYFALTGIGVREAGCRLGIGQIRAGDRILVSGPVGDHGIAVMLAR
jgi:hydrogenase expression/formation protein HypE